MPVLEWRQAARADLLAIIDYISDDNPDAAQKLKNDIEAKAARLLENPNFTVLAASPIRAKWSCDRTTSSSIPMVPKR